LKWVASDGVGRYTSCQSSFANLLELTMEGTIKIALVSAGMFGGEAHAHAYAYLQRTGISPHLNRGKGAPVTAIWPRRTDNCGSESCRGRGSRGV